MDKPKAEWEVSWKKNPVKNQLGAISLLGIEYFLYYPDTCFLQAAVIKRKKKRVRLRT